jgi:hypothetical protein
MEPLEQPKPKTRTKKSAVSVDVTSNDSELTPKAFNFAADPDSLETILAATAFKEQDELQQLPAQGTLNLHTYVNVDPSQIPPAEELPEEVPVPVSVPIAHPVNKLKLALRFLREATLPRSFTASIEKQLFFFDPPADLSRPPVIQPGVHYKERAADARTVGESRALFMQRALAGYGASVSLSYENIPASVVDIYSHTIVYGFVESTYLKDMVQTLASRLLRYQQQEYSSSLTRLADAIELVDSYLKSA